MQRSIGGDDVLEASDGVEAVDAAVEHRPALIVMDARLPVLDGWKATERLKSMPATAGIPIVMLTAQVREGDWLQSQRAGCDAYLAKPCEPRRVLEEVRRWGAPG